MPESDAQTYSLSTAPPLPDTRELLILGRPEGGALDPETHQRLAGGLTFYAKGESVHLEPGDVADVPTKIALGFIAEGFAVDPNAPEELPVVDDPDPVLDLGQLDQSDVEPDGSIPDDENEDD